MKYGLSKLISPGRENKFRISRKAVWNMTQHRHLPEGFINLFYACIRIHLNLLKTAFTIWNRLAQGVGGMCITQEWEYIVYVNFVFVFQIMSLNSSYQCLQVLNDIKSSRVYFILFSDSPKEELRMIQLMVHYKQKRWHRWGVKSWPFVMLIKYKAVSSFFYHKGQSHELPIGQCHA